MFVKPASGLNIRDPFKRDHLPPEGREVPDGDLYWERLLIDGDVIAGTPTAASESSGAMPQKAGRSARPSLSEPDPS